MSAIDVDPGNADALRAWDGADGAYWAANATVFDGGLARYSDAFFAATALAAGERVLDIGCGNGATTLEAARRVTPGRVLGLDLSAGMLAVARRRAGEQGLGNVEFVQADAQVHGFETGAFDVAISRAGVMFFADAVAAFTNIGRALPPGGRLAVLVWQGAEANEWLREIAATLTAGRTPPAPPPDAPGPLSLADPERVRSVLTAAGFADVTLTGASEPMHFGADPDAAYRFLSNLPFARFMVRDLDAETRTGALAALRATIEAHHTGEGVCFDSAAWVVTARRG